MIATSLTEYVALFGALPASGFVCAGIPFDGTASSRPGAAEGPRAIRVASLVYSSYVDSLGEDQMVDLRSGARFVYRRPVVCDVGDLHVFPTDVRRTLRTVAAEVARLQGDGRVPILLGGDHSITVPCVAGVLRGRPDAAAEGLGFVHIDHHFDRTSSSPGVGAATRRVQLDMLLAASFNVVTASDIRRLGAAQALEPALDGLRRRCRHVYVTLDIDVLDCSVAPGTGNVTIGGPLGRRALRCPGRGGSAPHRGDGRRRGVAAVRPEWAHRAHRGPRAVRAALPAAGDRGGNMREASTAHIARIERTLHEARPEWAVHDLRHLGSGLSFEVLRAESCALGPVVIRTASHRVLDNDNDLMIDTRDLLRQEALLAGHLRRHGVPTPVVHWLHLGSDGDFLLSEFVASDSTAPAMREVGRLAALIHAAPVPDVHLAEQGLLDVEDLIVTRLRRRFSRMQARASVSAELPPDAELRALLRWPAARRALLHMDLRAANLLCHEGHVQAVVDWANAVVGDPALELARIAEYGEVDADFLLGYEEIASLAPPPEPVETLYRLDTAVMLANVFLSESPAEDLARRQVHRVRELLARLLQLGGTGC